MSPQEIVSRISPEARTQALIRFLSIGDGQPFQAEQLALYNSLRTELLTRAGVPPVIKIREYHRPRGTGGVHTLRSKDLAALQQRAAALIGGIDTHRSPAAGRPRLNPATGEHVIEVRYHGV